jgi:hypothetical protein
VAGDLVEPGVPLADSVQLRFGPNQFFAVDQRKGPVALVQTVNSPAANHGEAAIVPQTLLSLNDANPTVLSDVELSSSSIAFLATPTANKISCQ